MTRIPASKTVWPKAWVESIKEGRLDILIKFRQFAGGTWEINGVTASGVPVILIAQYHGKTDIVNWLLQQGIELCPWSAAAIGRLDWLQDWYEHLNEKERLYELTARSSEGWTVMHLAAFNGQIEVINWLLEIHAPLDVLSENANANQPLHVSIASKKEAVAERLIDAGAPLTYEAEGWTPLRLAQENGMDALVQKIERRLAPL